MLIANLLKKSELLLYVLSDIRHAFSNVTVWSSLSPVTLRKFTFEKVELHIDMSLKSALAKLQSTNFYFFKLALKKY